MRKLFFIFFMLIALKNHGQDYKLGKVTIQELSEKQHPLDSTAAAAILFKNGETKFSYDRDGKWFVTSEIDFKIKIYKKDGFDQATQAFNYYVGGVTDEKVIIDKAITYNLENGAIVKTKLLREGEFDEELNDNWKIKKITMPNIKEGSIIEFSYRLISPYLWNINDFYFQSNIPVNHVKYKLYTPEYFRYRTIVTGYEKLITNSDEQKLNSFAETINTYEALNLPAIKEENYIHNIKNYLSALKCELVSINYPGQSSENFSVTWDDVVKTIYDNSDFGRQLNLKSYFEEDLNLILKDVETEKDKMHAILKFVQNRMTWNQKNRVLCKDGVKKAYKDRVGNSAEINLMLVAMLRYAGIDANPILLSTRSNGIVIFPTTNAFNYVIAGVEILNDVIMLDATNKNSLPDIISIEALNWSGRIVRESGSSTDVNLIDIAPSLEVNTVLCELDKEGVLKGEIRRQYYDYNAYLYKNYGLKLSQEERVKRIEKKYHDIFIDQYSLKDENNSITEQFSFEHSNISEKIGDKIYISPALFYNITENPFKSSVRKYPVDFQFPYEDKYKISIKIPDGYSIDKIPKPISLSLNGGYANYMLKVNKNGKFIQVIMNFAINTMFIPATEYDLLKTFYNEIIKTHEDYIILLKD